MLVVRIKLLDRAGVGFVFGEEIVQLLFELDEAIRDRCFHFEPDDAAVHERRTGRPPVDDAVTGELQAGIDADDAHAASKGKQAARKIYGMRVTARSGTSGADG